MVWGWASYRFLQFTGFFLFACPFVSRDTSFIYDVRVRGVVSMFNEPLILSLCGVVRARLLPCRVVVTAKQVASCTRITCIQPLSRCSLTLLASSFFSESSLSLSLSLSLSFTLSLSLPPPLSPCVLSFLSLASWPFRTRLLACSIRAAILYFSCRLHLFTSRCFVIGSPDLRFDLSICSLCFSRWKPGEWRVS